MYDVNEGSTTTRQLRQGELMRLVADRLTRKGYDVSLPEHADGCRMSIAGQVAPCKLSVSDSGYVQWDCGPNAVGGLDPARLADLATLLLTGKAGDRPHDRREPGPANLTFKASVGLDLRARGLQVVLNVCEDVLFLDAVTEIVVTSHDTDGSGEVHINDSGSFTWERDFFQEAAASTVEPEFDWWIADPAKLADTIAGKVTHAISECLPTGQP